jgi:hypothetical protein
MLVLGAVQDVDTPRIDLDDLWHHRPLNMRFRRRASPIG